MTPDLAKLKAAALAATKGPWHFDDNGCCYSDSGDPGPVLEPETGAFINVAKKDAAFIAAASPDVVFGLVEEIERLRSDRTNAIAAMRDQVATVLAYNDAAEKRVAELEIALRKHGVHTALCLKKLGKGHCYPEHCGLDAVLAGTAEPSLPDLDLLRKFASGEGGRRTGDLIRRGFIKVEVTAAGREALGGGVSSSVMPSSKHWVSSELLKTYGEHRWKCAISVYLRSHAMPRPTDPVCDCGWDEVRRKL